jgi:hypothetical protein
MQGHQIRTVETMDRIGCNFLMLCTASPFERSLYPGDQLPWHVFAVLQVFQDIALNQATTASFHILSNSVFTDQPIIRRYVVEHTVSLDKQIRLKHFAMKKSYMAYWYNKTFAVKIFVEQQWPLKSAGTQSADAAVRGKQLRKAWPVKFGNPILESVPCFSFITLLRFSLQSAVCFTQCRTLSSWMRWSHAIFPEADVLIVLFFFYCKVVTKFSEL